jgi:hypothetical protein
MRENMECGVACSASLSPMGISTEVPPPAFGGPIVRGGICDGHGISSTQ